MKNPTISVIIPLYNKESNISQTVHSVLEQSIKEFELIIVDDGSTDNSLNIIKDIHDVRIRLIRQENGGPSKARNTGVTYAQGDWILFLDADDELMDRALENFTNLIVSNREVGIFCCEFLVKTKSKTQKPYTYHNTIAKNVFKSWFFAESLPRTGATIYKRCLVQKCPFNEHIKRFEDLECIFRMAHFSKVYVSHTCVLTMNADFCSASTARTSITEDFLGHLEFKGKSFWEKMSLYQFYLWERNHYPEEVDKLYPTLRWRYDLLILNKILHYLKNHHVL